MKSAIQILFLSGLMLLAVSCKKQKDTAATATDPVPVTETASVETKPEQTTPSVVATYEKTPCFGMCPIFKFTLFSDGNATYVGKNNVNLIGTYHTKLDATALQKLNNAAQKTGYFSMQENYDNPQVTDLPSVITEISNGTELKKVRSRRGAPSELKTVHGVFDEIIASAIWEKN
jgi:hypothetical protein